MLLIVSKLDFNTQISFLCVCVCEFVRVNNWNAFLLSQQNRETDNIKLLKEKKKKKQKNRILATMTNKYGPVYRVQKISCSRWKVQMVTIYMQIDLHILFLYCTILIRQQT